MAHSSDRGFTIIELLVAIGLFAAISVSFYQVLFSARAGSETARDVVKTSEEARLGFNRMVRDTRQAAEIITPTATAFTVQIDFNGDGAISPMPTDPTGSYEQVTYAFDAALGSITIAAGGPPQVLIDGVECIPKASPPASCHAVFRYFSSRLEYDTNADGITDESELKVAPLISNGNAVLDGQELDFVDAVSFAFRVRQQDSIENFYAQAQLRNQR